MRDFASHFRAQVEGRTLKEIDQAAIALIEGFFGRAGMDYQLDVSPHVDITTSGGPKKYIFAADIRVIF